MRDPVQAMINAIERDRGGVAIVWYPDLGLRDWLVGEVESLAPAGSHPVRKVDVDGALAAPASLVLLVPAGERDVVLDLDASRDRLLDAPGPRSRSSCFSSEVVMDNARSRGKP